MSTLIGSNQTNIFLEPGLVRVRVGGEIAMEVSDPGESGGGFATKDFVDAKTIGDLTAQDGNIAAGGRKWTDIGAPVNGNDLATKTYTDDVSQISVGIANNTTVTSALTANQTDVACGTTPVNMNGQRITGLAVATQGTDLLSRDAGDARYIQQTTPLNGISVSGDLDMNSQKLTNLAAPALSTDGATKLYADQGTGGIRQDQIQNQTATGSRLVAEQTQILADAVPLNANSQRILSLGDATTGTDALNRQTGDGRYIQNSVALNSFANPAGNLDANSQKITGLASATAPQDAIGRDFGDARYYLASALLNEIAAATDSLDLGSQKITDLGAPTATGDMATKQYIDDQVSLHDASAQQLVSGVNSDVRIIAGSAELINNNTALNMNSQRITGLASATAGSDAMSRDAGDARYYQQTASLDQLTVPAASLSLNSQKITGLADATAATDAVNRQTGDGRYYSNTTTLDLITAPAGDLSLGGFKLTNVLDHATNNNLLNMAAGDSRYYSNTTALNAIAAPTAAVSLASQKITSLATPTLSTDLASRGYVTGAFYGNTTPLNSITAPTGSVSLASQKITSLATPTLSTDMATRGYATGSFYANTTTLNSITAPTAAVSLNSQKITSLATPTLTTDMVTKAYIDAAILPIRMYPFTLNIGNFGTVTFASTANIITSISQTSPSGSQLYITCNITNPWSADYVVMLTVRSNRGVSDTRDNDLECPLVLQRSLTSFRIYLEETVSNTKDISLDGIISRSP